MGTGREVVLNGRAEPTAFVRRRVDGPVLLGTTGLSGNELATERRLGMRDHAVYLFAAKHYRHFERALGRSLAEGSFAENILYDGPDEHAFRIGDRLRIGAALIEIVAPRTPCYKLAHFLGTDAGFPSRFSASGRTGFYARVLEPAEIREGCPILVETTDPQNTTVAELNETLTHPRPRADLVAAVMASPALRPGLKAIIDERNAEAFASGGPKPHQVTVAAREQETPDIVTLSFAMPLAPDQQPSPGQFVTFGITDDTGRQHFRCYSLTDGPFVRQSDACSAETSGPDVPYRIAVKRDRTRIENDTGEISVSNWVHDRIATGDACTVYPPAGNFRLPDAPHGPLAFLAGGIGITPILAQIRALADAGHADPVSLTYVCRTADDLAFMEQLANCSTKLGRFAMRVFLTRPDDRQPGVSPMICTGRPDLRAEIAALDDSAHLFVCGPAAMIAEVRAIHAGLGCPNRQLHFELFSDDAALEAPGEAASEAAITLRLGTTQVPGQTTIEGQWHPSDGALLRWIETRTGHRPPAACRSGLCRTCSAALLRGTVVYPPGVRPPSPSEVLLCCAMPTGDVEIALPAGQADRADQSPRSSGTEIEHE